VYGRGENSGSTRAEAPSNEDLLRAIRKLSSLRDGDIGVVDVVVCGPRAVPLLRDMLFAREPSGIYETRRRVVEALAQLHADDVLIDYLRNPNAVSDPVEQVGEDAVINAIARALAGSRRAEVIALLLAWAQRRPLSGVIDALGRLGVIKAIPFLVSALVEDECRPSAEGAIRLFGRLAAGALFESAVRSPRPGEPVVLLNRARSSALKLLAEMGPPSSGLCAALRPLMQDCVLGVAFASCQICLQSADRAVASTAALRLIGLLAAANSFVSSDIEKTLAENFVISEPIIRDRLQSAQSASTGGDSTSRVVEALRRVVAEARIGSNP
jgi:hypothetical protein